MFGRALGFIPPLGRLGAGRLGAGRLGAGRLGAGRLGAGRGAGRLGAGRLEGRLTLGLEACPSCPELGAVRVGPRDELRRGRRHHHRDLHLRRRVSLRRPRR